MGNLGDCTMGCGGSEENEGETIEEEAPCEAEEKEACEGEEESGGLLSGWASRIEGLKKDVGQNWKAVSILDSKTKKALGPMALRKAGAIVENMQGADYPEEKIEFVCRGLFCKDEESLKQAFDMFDADGGGTLDAEEFKLALPLMGEEVSAEEVETLYKEADADASGKIDFDEFCFLVKAMNPDEVALGGEGEDAEGEDAEGAEGEAECCEDGAEAEAAEGEADQPPVDELEAEVAELAERVAQLEAAKQARQ